MSGRKKSKSKVYYPSGTILHISTHIHKKDGGFYLKEETVKEVLEKRKDFYETYAYIIHDKDIYNGEGVEEREDVRNKLFIARCSFYGVINNLPEDETQKTGYSLPEEVIKNIWAGIDNDAPAVKVGDVKTPHFHIILQLTKSRKIDEVARWFGIDPEFIEIKKGNTALSNALTYLVHGHDKNKYQYNPEEVIANFDYVNDLEERLVKEALHNRYHVGVDDINDVIAEVADNGLSLKKVKETLSSPVYMRNKRLFEKAREEYILTKMKMPPVREVFFIDSEPKTPEDVEKGVGRGRVGKTACTHALAKLFAADRFDADITQDYEDLTDYIYDTGDAKVALDKYDGQPILVINEMSGKDMRLAFGGINGVKEMLDPFPTKQAKNVKYGSVSVMAQYIIINSIQTQEKFLDELAGGHMKDGEYIEGEKQAMEQFIGRIWVRVHIINSETMKLYFNKGIFDDTDEYLKFYETKNIKANFGEFKRKLSGEALAVVEAHVLQDINKKVLAYETSHQEKDKIADADKVTEYIQNYGPTSEDFLLGEYIEDTDGQYCPERIAEIQQ